MDDNNIDNEENHPEQEQTAASNDRASATTAEINKQGLQRAPDDALESSSSTSSVAVAVAAAAAADEIDDDNEEQINKIKDKDIKENINRKRDHDDIMDNKKDDSDSNSDINSESSDSDSGDKQSLSEEEQIAAAAAADTERKQKDYRLQLISCLQGYNTFTLQTRSKTDEMVDEFLEELLEFADIHDWVCKLCEDEDVHDSDSNSDINSDSSDSDSGDEQSLSEEEQIAAAADTERKRKARLELMWVLQGYGGFTLQTRSTIDEAVLNFDIRTDIYYQISEFFNDFFYEDVRTLDSDRDTEAQVEAILRFFPQVLTRKKQILTKNKYLKYYPIELLAFALDEGHWQCNVKAVSFIPTFARIAIEFDLFEEEERGGLLCQDIDGDNVLHLLMLSVSDRMTESQEYYESIDTKYLQVLIQLRRMDLLKKEDIQRYRLLHMLCREDYFAGKRYRFLVEWDPNALTQTDEHGRLPIYCQACLFCIQDFQLAFENGILYFPKKNGINFLFRKDKFGETPFQKACEKYKPKQVMEIVEDTLIRYITSFDNHASPLNIVDALMMAAIEENVHLDSVYTLIRRQPDILPNILSESDADTDADVDATSEVI